jgi:Flp pilus assembly pilin Flp
MNKLQTAIGVRLALALAGLSTMSVTERLKRDEGQTFVEYAMILALIGIGLTAALLFLRGKIASAYSAIGNGI